VSGLTRMANVTASTKRKVYDAALKVYTAPSVKLTGLSITPLDWVGQKEIENLQIEVPVNLLQTFIEGDHDIVEEDFLVVSGADYQVRLVQEWVWHNTQYMHVYVEKVKK